MQFLWNKEVDSVLLSAVYAVTGVWFSHAPAKVMGQIKKGNRAKLFLFSSHCDLE